MAKRRNSYKRRNNNRISTRQIVMIAGLVILAGCVVFKIYREKAADPKVLPESASGGSGELTVGGQGDLGSTVIDTDISVGNTDSNDGIATGTSTSYVPEIKSAERDIETTKALELFKAGKALFDSKKFFKASLKLTQAVEASLSSGRETEARKMLNKASSAWLFSKNMYPGSNMCSMYKVASGDGFGIIGKRANVPHELLMKVNGYRNERNLPAGANLKVIRGPFHVEVCLSEFTLTVFLPCGNDNVVIVKSYPVTTGKINEITGMCSTPIGLWEVKLKQVNPEWPDRKTGKIYAPDDPENPLGERWIALKYLEGDAPASVTDGIGIHGTIRPDEIGKNASRGCIRLKNIDVEELFDMMNVTDSKVRIIP